MFTFHVLGLGLCLIVTSTGASVTVVYSNRKRFELYDYIIVGAGSAGSVIANRLSEDKNVTVLLIEAGGPPPLINDIPLKCFDIEGRPETDWQYYTEPQPNACLNSSEQRCFLSRFKGLGGCSSHNTMMHVRGNHKDYNNWATLGAVGWGWKDVQPLFKKSEDYRILEYVSNGFHGSNGYLTISPPVYKSPLHDILLEAGRSLGYKNVDYNGPFQKGFNSLQLTQRDGLRCSTEKAYLRPAVNRPNLDILMHARVLKIKFDKDKRARYVIYDQDNKTKSATARREIILSAGAIGSPHLLLLSGVGPAEQLEKFGIPVIANLSVGYNFQDHPHISGLIWKLNASVSFVASRDVNDTSLGELLEGRGAYTTAHAAQTVIFTDTKYQDENDTWPDIVIYPIFTEFTISNAEYGKDDGITLLPTLLRPKSRGFLKLKSADPYEHPLIDPRYLFEEDDALRLIEALKFARKIMKTPALQKYNPTPSGGSGGCEHLDGNSDDYLNCTVYKSVASLLHLCGTTKMGNPGDSTTVVDPELRVKGVKGLRVADASVMPAIVSGNTNAACVMIGEKAAQMIRGY